MGNKNRNLEIAYNIPMPDFLEDNLVTSEIKKTDPIKMNGEKKRKVFIAISLQNRVILDQLLRDRKMNFERLSMPSLVNEIVQNMLQYCNDYPKITQHSLNSFNTKQARDKVEIQQETRLILENFIINMKSNGYKANVSGLMSYLINLYSDKKEK